MRRFFLLLIILISGLVTHAQVKKLYGYAQEVNGGARQINDDPNNDKSTNNNRYFLFAEIKKGSKVSFEQVWINGDQYAFKTDTIRNIPFVLQTSNGGELVFRDTLVRSSAGTIIQLKDLVMIKSNKTRIMKNNVTIWYRYRNKLQSISLQKLKKIHPLFTQ